MRTPLIFLSFFFSLVCAISAKASPRPDAELIKKAQALAQEGKTEAAEQLLLPAIDAEKDRERRALLRLSLAMIFFRSGPGAKAEEQFLKAIDDGARIKDYALYHVGLLKRKSGQPKDARTAFEKVIQARPSAATEHDARYQIAQIHMAEKEWRLATVQLETLKRTLKSDERYSDVLYDLAVVERKAGRKASSCKWARELYAKYPTATPLKEWGPHLEKNLIEGEKSGCSASNKDLKTRVRRLWLSGEDERAAAELKQLKDETDDEGNSLIDNLTVNHLIGDGRHDEAMTLLLNRYEAEHNRPPYLLLLAKAAASAGDNQVAVASYQRAFELAPRGKSGENSLFQAAFTSYQMQDYDGASRRFEQLQKTFRNSRLARESQWYVAFIRYLRGDYQGAYEYFASFGKPAQRPTRKGRRKGVAPSELVAQDRMQYWMAMSLFKQGKKNEALPIFQKLARDPSLGYYAILAYYRLISIPDAQVPPTVETHFGLKPGKTSLPTDEEVRLAALAAEELRAEYEAEIAKPQETESSETETGDEEELTETDDQAPTPPVSVALPVPAIPTFKDAGLAQRFERVRDLVIVGLENGARRELREIEKRARSVADRKLLMNELANVKNYDRSSYIAEVGFGAARLSGGLKGDGRVYWEAAYPRAWEPSVAQSAKATAVPEELIWGIMRAESHFRSDAQSPVGALGLMQLMPFTSKKVADLLQLKAFETRTLLEPEVNIRLGSRYLQRLVEKFDGKVPLVAGAYNAGPHRVHAWVRNFGMLDMDEFIEHIPYIETRGYVKRVARNFQIYSLLYRGNAQAMRWMIQPVGVRRDEPYPQKEIW